MTEVTPVPAATVTLVRDSDAGLEVLMLQRNFQSGFMPGMYVFPGGALDAADYSPQACARCVGLDDPAASSVLKLERGGLAYWVAAIRESFEEAGILLACDARGDVLALSEPAGIERFRVHRQALNAGEQEFIALLARESLRLPADRLVYFSHWITPLGAPRRYDTRFFVARAPDAQDALHDNLETIDHVWVQPGNALEAHGGGKLNMRTPTLRTLELFARFAAVDELIAAMRTQHEVPAIMPRIAKDGRRVLPGDPGYEDAATVEGRGLWKI
jgi:8-oxo-dGTP pyrophosphatase MutT (NUDIX family)